MQEPREHSIDARGLKIHYLEWGDPAGEPLILIHGFLDHARSWQPFVASLQMRSPTAWRILAPDCRGHGDSGWVGAGGYYHFPDYLFDLDCLIHSLQASSVTLIGHSMGGTISFLYTGTFPKRVKKLILVEGIGPIGMAFADAPHRMERWLSEVRAVQQKKALEYASLEEAAQRLRRKNPRLKPELALELAKWGMRQTTSGKWIWKFDPLHRTTAPQPFYTGQALEFYRRIECPVLLIQGKESRHAPRPDLRQRLEAIADHTCVEIKDAGHMIHHDNPEGLAEVVAEFLRLAS
ncbi:MAG: alpha/beta hydrolase [Deltaproteobacteria bacterium]|nr:alpha/beta hydrolase [Deltaproteobacteria bacterium]